MNKRELEELNKKYNCTLTDEDRKRLFGEHYRHPNSLSNFEATVVWLAVMVIGAIFNDRIPIWIIATLIWFNYIDIS
jgi:hypothetical protein